MTLVDATDGGILAGERDALALGDFHLGTLAFGAKDHGAGKCDDDKSEDIPLVCGA